MEQFYECFHAGIGAKLHHSSPEAHPGRHSPPPEEAPTVGELAAGPAYFLPRQLPSGSLISQAGCKPACYLQPAHLQTLVPPFFGETRESPAGTPSPAAGSRVQSRPPPISLLSALDLDTNSSTHLLRHHFPPHLLTSPEKKT